MGSGWKAAPARVSRIVRLAATRVHYLLLLYMILFLGLPLPIGLLIFLLLVAAVEIGLARYPAGTNRHRTFLLALPALYLVLVPVVAFGFLPTRPYLGIPWTVTTLLLAGLVWLAVPLRRPVFKSLAIAGCCLAVLVQAAFLPSLMALGFMALGAVVMVVAGLVRPSSIGRIHPLHLSLMIVMVMVPAKVLLEYGFTDPDAMARVTGQPGVTALFRQSDDDPVGRETGRAHIRNILEGCRKGVFYISGHSQSLPILVEFHQDEGRAQVVPGISPDEGIALDCTRQRLFVGSRELLVELDIAGDWARPVQRIQTTTTELIEIRIGADPNRILALSDRRVFVLVDLLAGRQVFQRDEAGNAMALSGDRLVFRDRDRLRVFRLDPSAESLVEDESIPAHVQGGHGQIAAHPTRPFVFVNDNLGGTLQVFDLESRTKVLELPLAANMRYIDISPDGGTLATGSHLYGDLFLIDTARLLESLRIADDDARLVAARQAVTRHLDVGRLARRPRFSRDGAAVYIPSRAGGFKVDLAPPHEGGR